MRRAGMRATASPVSPISASPRRCPMSTSSCGRSSRSCSARRRITPSAGRRRFRPDGAAPTGRLRPHRAARRSSTRLLSGPVRQASIIASTDAGSPANTASTEPSRRLRTQPSTPRENACARRRRGSRRPARGRARSRGRLFALRLSLRVFTTQRGQVRYGSSAVARFCSSTRAWRDRRSAPHNRAA